MRIKEYVRKVMVDSCSVTICSLEFACDAIVEALAAACFIIIPFDIDHRSRHQGSVEQRENTSCERLASE